MLTVDNRQRWQRFLQHVCRCDEIGLTLDISRMNFDDGFFDRMAPAMDRAYKEMTRLESGEKVNPDETDDLGEPGRMVGHYWLRAPQLAPTDELRQQIEQTRDAVLRFADQVHRGEIAAENGRQFTDLLVIGIGGSALGPQFVSDALADRERDRLRVRFFDNTDPDGMQRTLKEIGPALTTTLHVVISKSGTTPETRNGMIVAREACEAMGLTFARHAVAVTGVGSELDGTAENEGWLARFAMWDWVGGRTSETSAVGLLPAALQGIDVKQLLTGAAACDVLTRQADTARNPAALLALMWYYATDGRGERDMVILPYRDRLLLLSRYLQQLLMESLGKREDRSGNVVEQGIAVYGNKGSTDQHAYVQQLRDGVNNFFVTFIAGLDDGGDIIRVDDDATSGDYLRGFMLGTRQALADVGRESITITVPKVEAYHVGVLIALYERAVGFYAALININAYHQPGVEAGKKAAKGVLELQRLAMDWLGKQDEAVTAEQIAEGIGQGEHVETIWHVLHGLAANGRGIEPDTDAPPDRQTFRSTA